MKPVLDTSDSSLNEPKRSICTQPSARCYREQTQTESKIDSSESITANCATYNENGNYLKLSLSTELMANESAPK